MPAKRPSEEFQLVNGEAVEHLRDTLLRSDTFRNNFRSKEILTFLFSQFKNRAVTSERDVAQACYANPTASGKVRVAIHQLRSQLGKYFAGEGRTSDLVVEIPKGRYALRFVSRASAEKVSSSESPARWTNFAATPLFVGRRDELALLRRTFDEVVASERPQVLCITGAPGMGKSALAAHFLHHLAQETDVNIGIGRGVPLHGAERYIPILDALDSLVESSAPLRKTLLTVAPSWAQETTTTPGNAVATPRVRELRTFFETATRRRPIVLFFDDYDAVDHSSADLLTYIAEHIAPMQLLIVAAYRESHMRFKQHSFLETKANLQMRGACQEISTPPFTVQDIGEYIERRLPGVALPTSLTMMLAGKSDGNPLILAALVQLLIQKGTLDSNDPEAAVRFIEQARLTPPSKEQMLLTTLERLSDRDRQLPAIASLLGHEFDAEALARMAQIDIAVVEEHLARLVAASTLLKPIEREEVITGSRDEYRKCDLDGCTRRMRKVRTGRGGIMLSKQQMLEGFGGAEECQQCGALHCDACYPQRDNVCVRCQQRALRLVMVQYATGTTALWPRPPAPAVAKSRAGSAWAISLRMFLATQGQSHLEAAATQLAAELSALPPPRSGLRSLFDNNTERRALESAWSTMQKVALEDRSPAVPQSEETARLLRRCDRPDDAESVLLIGPDWQVRMGQSYMMAPPFLQDQILRSGLDACKRCATMMHSLGDFFCEAEYLTRLGNGLYSARRLEDAEEAFSGALSLWRGLAQSDPGLLVKVGRTLQHLGTTQSARGEYTGCASSYREAIEVLESCADGQRDLTAVLNNLGNFHLHRHEYESASSCFERAVSILEALIRSGVTRSTEDPFSPLLSMQLAVVRGNLALCLGELGSLDRAAELIQRTIRDEVNHQDGGNDQARLQLAKLRATLGRIRLQLWTRESNYGQVPHDDLLDAALHELSLATGVFREHLQVSRLAAYLPAVILGLTAHGLALGYRRDFGPAADIIEEACRLADSPSLWFERMQALDARRELEVTRQGEPTAGFEYARRAVETAEKGMSGLSEAERVNRDLVKSRVEMSYLSCIANLTQRKDYEDLFHVLEAMRRIDRLTQSDEHSVVEIDLHAAKALARKHGFTYIASQAAPGGTVFFVIEADGEVTAESAVQGWANKAFQFSTEIDNAARALEFFGAPDLEKLTHQAASLFDDLPANAKRALGTGSGPIFLSMGADQHNLPMELLYDRSRGWLGLQRICARTRSFEELAAITERQPTAKSPSATVAAGPGENFERIVAMAKSIGAGLVSSGFTLRPADQVLEGDALTRWKFLDTIDRDPSMVVFVGHGGNDDNGPFLQISTGDRLRPRDVAQLRFDSGPIAHLECCIAGHAVYFGGGYWNSYAVSFLANGASCCLVSNRIVFGEPSAFFCRELYGQLTGTESLPIGAALLEARRRTAGAYPNPLFWATPVLYGNPEARLR